MRESTSTSPHPPRTPPADEFLHLQQIRARLAGTRAEVSRLEDQSVCAEVYMADPDLLADLLAFYRCGRAGRRAGRRAGGQAGRRTLGSVVIGMMDTTSL